MDPVVHIQVHHKSLHSGNKARPETRGSIGQVVLAAHKHVTSLVWNLDCGLFVAEQ